MNRYRRVERPVDSVGLGDILYIAAHDARVRVVNNPVEAKEICYVLYGRPCIRFEAEGLDGKWEGKRGDMSYGLGATVLREEFDGVGGID